MPGLPFRPPVPEPRTRPLGLVAFLKAARANPITTRMRDHFEEPVIAVEGAMGHITFVSDPELIRYLFVENARNYRKDNLQRRVLAPGLGNGLLTVEGEDGVCNGARSRRSSPPATSPDFGRR